MLLYLLEIIWDCLNGYLLLTLNEEIADEFGHKWNGVVYQNILFVVIIGRYSEKYGAHVFYFFFLFLTDNAHINISDQIVENVKEYVYLGHKIKLEKENHVGRIW